MCRNQPFSLQKQKAFTDSPNSSIFLWAATSFFLKSCRKTLIKQKKNRRCKGHNPCGACFAQISISFSISVSKPVNVRHHRNVKVSVIAASKEASRRKSSRKTSIYFLFLHCIVEPVTFEVFDLAIVTCCCQLRIDRQSA